MKTIKMFAFQLIGLLSLGLALSACGSPSGLELCKSACERVGSCSGNSQGEILDCKTGCDRDEPDRARCVNEGRITECYSGCLDRGCNEIVDCLGACERCVQ